MWSKLFQPAAELPALPEGPDLLPIFGPTDALLSSGVLARLHERFPSTPLLACSTGSSVAAVSLDETGLQAVAVGFSRAQVRLHTQPLPEASQSRLAGQKLAGQIATDNLVGVILFSVGLDVNGSHLVEGVQDILGREAAISGGLAGDGERFGDICLDLDRLKAVNDTLGHPVGDALLVAVAKRLRTLVLGNDVVARLGGDEFAVVLRQVWRQRAVEHFAQRVIRSLSRKFNIKGHDILIGAGLGVALEPVVGLEPNEALRRADLALCAAKSDGRSTFRILHVGDA